MIYAKADTEINRMLIIDEEIGRDGEIKHSRVVAILDKEEAIHLAGDLSLQQKALTDWRDQ